MEDRTKEAEKIVSEMNKDFELSKIEEFIKDNKISFTHNDKQYRVRLLNAREKEELDLLRARKFGELMKDKNILTEKEIMEVSSERNLEIGDINDQIKKSQSELEDLNLKLGEAISKNVGEVVLKEYKNKIEELEKIKIPILNTRKNLLLQFSLENQLLNYVAQIITYLSLEVMEEGIWKKAFNNFEIFQNCQDEQLIEKAATYSLVLQYV